ncbi:hypothetical protein GAH_01277 [Geoglobus ahangari]|uniref:Uncharacterized protein n=1 Tax=Geoglobus ahangari TaxID=113653 RepID=A0A0F7DBN9_9EURY|nr:hypothetical protein [Geoglobus ahangari]AKG91421.1 hypothetical protein GAH_01277 [Geoglobus ahangari]
MMCEKYKRKVLPIECDWYACSYWVGSGGVCFNGRVCFLNTALDTQSTL